MKKHMYIYMHKSWVPFIVFFPSLCYDRCLSSVQISDLMTLYDFRIIIPDDFGTIFRLYCIVFYRTLLTKNRLHLCGPFFSGSDISRGVYRVETKRRLQRSRIVARLTSTSISICLSTNKAAKGNEPSDRRR